MSIASIVSKGNSRFGLEGVLDFTNVRNLAAEGERVFPARGRVEIDLRGVSSSNSAGLALLLEWVVLARRRGLSLRFRNLPDSLVRLAGLTNISGLLPMVRQGA